VSECNSSIQRETCCSPILTTTKSKAQYEEKHGRGQVEVNSAFHPPGVGKSSTGLSDGVKAGRVHQATLWIPYNNNNNKVNLYTAPKSKKSLGAAA